ncbi:hypothetical protein [Paraburkholderia sp. J63]|uniref:hypothetical protein n=1 Tax=Paraburkholderia sp. J63 TaxID=2805434 RepID=UPI002ABD8317|nr:hypothetical protein [Paraburkholderia sp. J63]
MEFEFSWMTYFVALFALMACSIALTLLCPVAGKRDDGVDHESGAEAFPPMGDSAHGTSQQSQQADHRALPAHPVDGA